MTIPDYSGYDLQQFIDDREFRARVLAPDFPVFRNAVLAAWPEKAAIVDDAAFIVRHLQMSHDALPDESRQRIWQTLATRQAERHAAAIAAEPASSSRRWLYLGAAALAAVLLLFGLWLYARRAPAPAVASVANVTERTGFGETKSVLLPDGSIVLLNGNSQLTYVGAGAELREVWLRGEAFFKVARKTTATGAVKFVVHSPDLDVEVLGTQFNVNTRRGKTRVVLVEGSIRLVDPKSPARASARQPKALEMKPGQMAVATPERPEPAITAVDPERAQAWTLQKFLYDNTPLAEVAGELEDTYGLAVTFADPRLGDLRLTANLSNQDLETLLLVIEATFKLKIERDGRRVTIADL